MPSLLRSEMVLHSVRLPAGGTDVTEPCAFNLAGLRLMLELKLSILPESLVSPSTLFATQ